MENNNIFEKYLNNFRVSGDDKFNFISMGENFKGKFYIKDDKIENFYKIYTEAAEKKYKLSIAEKPKDYGPILIDIDLKIDKNKYVDGTRLYNDEMIKLVIDTYRQALNNYLDLSEEEISVSLFEKSKPTKIKDYIKDGFHLIFAGINIHYKLRYVIRNYVIELLKDNETFKNFNESIYKIFDLAVIYTNCWLLPFSKKPDGHQYKLKYIYDHNNEPINITKILSNKSKQIEMYNLNNDMRCKANETSFNNDYNFEKIETEFNNLNNKKEQPKENKPNIINDDITTEINNCLECIDNNDNYENWLNVALIINNELGFNGWDILDEWSKTAKNYDYEKNKKFYNNIKPKENGLKIGTLKKMAKEANPELYKKYFYKPKVNKTNDTNKEDTSIDGVYNDLKAAQMVYKLYPHWVCCNSLLFVFDDKTGLWSEAEEVMFNIISRYNEHLYLLTINKNNEVKKTSKGYGNTTTLKRQMLPELKSLCINNSWLTDTNLTSLKKLLFLNGYLDMTTGIFYNEFRPDIVFFNRIHRNYSIDNLDIKYIKSVKERFFYNQLGEEVGNYLIENIARSLAGDRMKKIFFGLGETNAGKSTVVIATNNTFGDYIGSFNGENLCIRNSSGDEAQIMRWSYLLRYKRIIFSNEMKQESVLSGNIMKKVSSGGDALTARVHNGLETPFIPHYNVFCNANDLLEIKPYDSAIHERLNIISYKKKYVDNPTNEYELKKDDKIDEEMKTEKFKETFSFIITEAYLKYCKNGNKENIPQSVINCKTEWVGEEAENTAVNKFLESYEITNNIEDYTKSSDFDLWLKESKITISVTKFTMELKKYCKIKKYNNVESKNKKLNKKCLKVWIGIKKINDDDDEPSYALDRL